MNKLFAAALATSTAVAVAAPATPASASSCAVTWGSLAKTAPPSHAKPVTNQPSEIVGLRTGRHACYDRLVIDTDAPIGAGVRYVKAVTDQGRGDVVPLRGGAFLEIVALGNAYEKLALPNVRGYRTFRQIGDGGSFEGYTTVGIGVRARLPFRVLTVGTKVVVDVAHHW